MSQTPWTNGRASSSAEGLSDAAEQPGRLTAEQRKALIAIDVILQQRMDFSSGFFTVQCLRADWSWPVGDVALPAECELSVLVRLEKHSTTWTLILSELSHWPTLRAVLLLAGLACTRVFKSEIAMA